MDLTDVLESRRRKCKNISCRKTCSSGKGGCWPKRKTCPSGYSGIPPSGKWGKRCCCKKSKPKPSCKSVSGKKCKNKPNGFCGKVSRCAKAVDGYTYRCCCTRNYNPKTGQCYDKLVPRPWK